MFDHRLNPPSLADALGMDRTSVTRYLSRKRMPSIANLISIADYFQCSTDYLLGSEGEPYHGASRQCPPFKERLSFLLDYYGMTKYKLQKMTGIPKSAIYNWQRGQNVPSVANTVKLADAFGCTVDFVLGRED